MGRWDVQRLNSVELQPYLPTCSDQLYSSTRLQDSGIQSLTAQPCPVSFLEKLTNIFIYCFLLEDNIPSPTLSSQNFNSSTKIPHSNPIVCIFIKMWHKSKHGPANLTPSLVYTCGFVLYEAKPSPEPSIKLPGTTRLETKSRLYPQYITQESDSNPPTHSESKPSSQ